MIPSLAVAALWAVCAVPQLVEGAPRSGKPMTDLTHSCSRAKSRLVRQRFNVQIKKRKGGDRFNASVPWPRECPFSPWVDLFGWHERNKTRGKAGSREWECNYTGKIFKNEHYIDLHLERLFAKDIPENGICLADYCDVFDFCNAREPSLSESLSSEPPPCDPAEFEKLKLTCHGIIDKCVPGGEGDKAELNADLQKAWCDALTCEARSEKHFHNRKWCLVISGILGTFIIGIFVLCLCVASQDNPDSADNRNRAYRNSRRPAPRAPGSKLGNRNVDKDVVDMVPTRLSKKHD